MPHSGRATSWSCPRRSRATSISCSTSSSGRSVPFPVPLLDDERQAPGRGACHRVRARGVAAPISTCSSSRCSRPRSAPVGEAHAGRVPRRRARRRRAARRDRVGRGGLARRERRGSTGASTICTSPPTGSCASRPTAPPAHAADARASSSPTGAPPFGLAGPAWSVIVARHDLAGVDAGAEDDVTAARAVPRGLPSVRRRPSGRAAGRAGDLPHPPGGADPACGARPHGATGRAGTRVRGAAARRGRRPAHLRASTTTSCPTSGV